MNSYCNRIQFPNGYTASVVCDARSYGGKAGLFEVAIMFGGRIVYDTPISVVDVVGHLDFSGVAELLKSIEALPPRS